LQASLSLAIFLQPLTPIFFRPYSTSSVSFMAFQRTFFFAMYFKHLFDTYVFWHSFYTSWPS
jgi:hypothetical protein